MKRFQFRLDAVLQYRRQLEELALADFQGALANERKAEDDVLQLKKSLLDVCQAGISGADGPFRLKRDEFKGQLAALIKKQSLLLEELRLLTLGKREQYLESKKETRILERLREKSWLAYQKSIDRLEQQEMDDLFLMKGKEDGELGRMT